MVVLNRIYTKTGDAGTTALGSGERVPKTSVRIAAYGTVDETNAQIGMVRIHLEPDENEVDAMMARIQNDLFDLGADLCVPDKGEKLPYEPLRMSDAQVKRGRRDRQNERGLEAAQIFRAARRNASRRSPARCAHGLPPGRAGHGRAGRAAERAG